MRSLTRTILLACGAFALAGCEPAPNEVVLSPFIFEPCDSLDGYQRVTFDFHEDWMEEYSFWVDQRATNPGPLGPTGEYLGDIHEHYDVQMRTTDGTCVFGGASKYLGAASIDTFYNSIMITWGRDLVFFYQKVYAQTQEPDFEHESSEVVFVSLRAKYPSVDGNVYELAVAGGEIISISWE